ncbi:MAG: SUMF1/EgtB/PvdO family nonheme iron enzyme [Trueperaceae bacterium]
MRYVLEGGSLALEVTVTVTPTADDGVLWGSSDEGVATVSAAGVVSGVSVGETTITATSRYDATKKDDVVVRVTPEVGVSGSTDGTYLTMENVAVGAPEESGSGSRSITLDLAWDESWRGPDRPSYVAADDNWDAVWLFVKYRVEGEPWRHATLASAGHAAPDGAVFVVVADGMGAFVYRGATGYGDFRVDDLSLAWSFQADGVTPEAVLEVRVFGIEMVYVPEGSFFLGSGGTGQGEFRAGGTVDEPFEVTAQVAIALGDEAGSLHWAEEEFTGIPSGATNIDFPTGFTAFYAMKHEITQGQYVAFLNTLTQTQADARHISDGDQIAGDTVGAYTATLPHISMGSLAWADGSAYAAWSGLRPMTELEFEKAARGPATPVPDEYAWGSTGLVQATGLVFEGTVDEAPTPASANANYGFGIGRPVRVGSFAAPGRTRENAGAGYYGVLELSGNLWENVVTVGKVEGRAFTGEHGAGSLDASGAASVSGWPASDAVGAGFRGGDIFDSETRLRVSDRVDVAQDKTIRDPHHGWRGVRTAP